MNLKFELDIIYQNVYKMNESLSIEDFEILKAGFEDGINEGFGKWLGTMAGKISKGASDVWTGTKKIANKVVDKTKDLYKKGKKWAADAWEKLKTWVSETTKTIRVKITDAAQWVSTKFNMFLEKIADLYKSMTTKIREAWDGLKDKSSKFLEAIKSVFSNLMTSIKGAISSATNKFIDLKDNLVNWVKTHWVMLKKWIVSTKDGVLSGLSKIFNKVIDLIKNGAKATAKYAKIIATFVIIKPALMIANGVKRIPSLYREYISRLKSFIKNEIEGFKIGFEEGSGRPWDRSKGFINPPKPPITPPNTPIVTSGSIVNPAQAEVNTTAVTTKTESMKYIKTFENFKY
jgi:phage-related protein